MEKTESQFKIDSELIATVVTFVGVGMVIAAGYLIMSEISSAESACVEINFTYKYKFPDSHLCNNESWFRYNDGWDFDREFNFTKASIP